MYSGIKTIIGYIAILMLIISIFEYIYIRILIVSNKNLRKEIKIEKKLNKKTTFEKDQLKSIGDAKNEKKNDADIDDSIGYHVISL